MSGPSGATKVGGAVRTVAQQASKAVAQRRVWNPHARYDAIPPISSSATSSGSMRRSTGSQNGCG